ncbi:cytochrome c oxidase assembly protein COX15 homolog [Cephus cinctus]|uniref:Cytochrome c oxidase assembly protein COX15 homolog n=1 Tax=Cephus cinctus TaxID=211228 RepID=A0AAJ7C3A1_CEPCN|nr:cytochrome c oxidase assembly protein COX15 homolog [Cephus cinctus]
MLNVTRYCTRTVTRCTFGKPQHVNRSLFATVPRKPVTNNSFTFLHRVPSQLGKIQALFRQTGTIAVSYASKVSAKSDKIVGSWMLTCSGMVFIAVVLGGVTRLTESGLSMVTWKLLGEKMPRTEAQWIEEFERYQQFPEFQILNKHMTLEEFKRIWWMEYLHRTWGRLIGGVFIVPAAIFWAKGMLKPGMKIRVLSLGALIGLQGLMGWYMVKSGLEDRFDGPSDVPRVSQYRLAAHLGLALTIYTGFLYNALDHLIPAENVVKNYFSSQPMQNTITKGLRKIRMLVHSSKGLIFLTAMSGAFVAGIDAGLIYNTFPKMANKWIPDDILALSPVLLNFTENPTTVQFDHRILGISTLTLITVMAMMSRKYRLPGRGSTAVTAVVCAGYLQVLLGISTLLNQVPLALAASHQAGSLLLLSAITWLCHELKHLRNLPK